MRSLALVFLLFFAANANAQSCTDGSTPDRVACLDAKGVALVKRLEAAYTSALSYAATEQPDGAPDLKKALTQSQSNWWKYRESECGAREAQFWGGTGTSLVVLECMNDLTERRIKELNANWSES